MESHRIKSLSTDKRSKNRLRFATNKQKSKRASADVYRRYKRRIGVTSSATREENVHHQKSSKRSRLNDKEHKEEESPEDVVSDETTLATELDLANDRNASEIFGHFYRETWPLIRSLPELIHHAEKVVDIFLRYLLSPEDAPGQKTPGTTETTSDEENMNNNNNNNNNNSIRRFQVNHATTEILHLLSVLARDLRHEVHPWLHSRVLPRIFNDLLNPPLPESGKQQIPLDVTVIEAAFRAVAYLLRYDAEALLSETSSSNNNKKEEQPCLEPMRRYYGYTLANKRPLIRRLAAETFAPLIRKLKSESAKKRHLRRVLRALDASSKLPHKSHARQKQNNDAVDGIAMLCLELSKGISGALNSKGSFVLDCLFECILADKQDKTSLSCEVASKMLEQLLKSLSSDTAAKILVSVHKQIQALLQGDQLEGGIGPLISFLRLAREIISAGDGNIVRETLAKDAVLAIISQVGEFMQSNTILDASCQLSIASLTRTAWEKFQNDSVAISTIRKTLARMLELKGNVQELESQMDEFTVAFCTCVASEIFSKLPLDLGLKHIGPLLLKVAAKSPTNTCLTLVHGLAACQNMDSNRKAGADDDTFLPEKAAICGLPSEMASTILDKIMLPLDELQADPKMVLYAAKCVAFTSLSSSDKGETERLMKKSTKWLGRLLLSNALTEDSLSTEKVLVFSACLESLSRLALIAGEDSRSIDWMADLLTKLKDVCHRVLLSNPTSVSLLKATAFYCRTLRLISHVLVDDSNAVFDILVPNLRSNVHFIRKHSLEILNSFPKKPFVTDHADLDLSEDLDEEPTNTKSSGQGPKGPIGPCDILETLFKVESLPVEMVSERPLLSLLSRVEIFARSGKLPIVYAEATVAHLLGLLYVKFAPVWPAAIKTLAAVVENHKNAAWSLIFSRLENLMESCAPSWDKQAEDKHDSSRLNFDIDIHFEALIEWERSGGNCWTLFDESIRMSNEMGKVSNFECRERSDVLKSIWELFETEPELIVSHSRDIVPLVIRFFRYHYFTESDPDGQEMFHEDDDDEKASTWRSSIAEVGRGGMLQKLLSILKAFAALKGPEQLVLHKKLHKIFQTLVGHTDTGVSGSAFSCILRFKPDFLLPYATTVQDLFAKGKLRDTMIRIKEFANNGKITSEHRRKMSPILARLLLGRLSSKSVGKSSKDSPAARRTAVFSFAAGFCQSDLELFPFVFLPVRRYIPTGRRHSLENCGNSDIASMLSDLACVSAVDCAAIPSQVHEGVLNVLEAIVSQLGHRVLNYVPSFMGIILSLLETYPLKDNSGNSEEGVKTGETPRSIDRSSRVRSLCFLRLAEIFDKFPQYDFSKYQDRMWNTMGRSIAQLPQLAKSSEKAPSLLQMLVILSKHEQLWDLLCSCDESISSVFSCLPQTESNSVVDAILIFVENIMTIAKEEGSKAHLSHRVLEHIPGLLKHFELRLDTFGTTASWRRELSILGRVCDVSKNKAPSQSRNSELDSLALLLIPYLGLKSKSSDRDRMHILDVLGSTIQSISKSTAKSLFGTVSSLLGPFKGTPGLSALDLREKLTNFLGALSEQHFPHLKVVCQVIENLSAVNHKVIDEVDAERVLGSLKDLRNSDSEASWLALMRQSKSRVGMLALIRSCFHLVYNSDGVISRAAFYSLQDLVARLQETESQNLGFDDEESTTWEKFLETSIVPLVRAGIACKDASPRRFFILLVAHISKACKDTSSPHLFGDLYALVDESDPNLDFFQNITHVQLHRRAVAFSRLAKHFNGEENVESFSVQTVSGVLIPIALHPIYESKTKLEEALAKEAINTLGSLFRALPWKKFQDELSTLLAQVDRQSQQERYIVDAICSVLSGFHFDVGNPYSKDADLVSRTAVWNSLEKRIIPRLESLFTKEKVGKKGDKIKVIRPHVILALTRLYKKLPGSILHHKLPRLITVICDALKSRESDARDLARKTLAKLSVEVGVLFLPDIVRELAVTLKEGYQLHVRSAAIHSILLEFWEAQAFSSEDSSDNLERRFDRSVSGLMDLVQQDLFGTAQARKDAELNQVRYVKEAGGSKSLHSIDLIASMIDLRPPRNDAGKENCQSSVYAIVSPLLQRMREEIHNTKQLRQIRECLSRIVQGLSKNKTFSGDAVLPLVYATIEPCVARDVTASGDTDIVENGGAIETTEGQVIQGEVAEWRPSGLGMSTTAEEANLDRKRFEKVQRKVVDGSEAPKMTGSGRQIPRNVSKRNLDDPASVAAVIFGLQALQQVLKKGSMSDSQKLLYPFLPLLTECICYCRDSEAVLLAMRCLSQAKGHIAKMPELGDSTYRTLASKTLDMLVGYGGNEDLLQASFKMMTFFFEKNVLTSKSVEGEEKEGILDEEQMEILLSFLQNSLTNAAQHNPAMGLVKALVARSVISPGMYDLMKVVLEESVHSHKETLRQQAAIVYVRFLLNYPMTSDRMEKELKQLLANIQFEGIEGRHSAISMVKSVIDKFPEPVVVQQSSLFFVALTMQLGNEESEKSRKLISDCLVKLINRLPRENGSPLLEYAIKWGQQDDDRLRRIALTVLVLFVDSSSTLMTNESTFEEVLKIASEALEPEEDWEISYFSLRLLEKLQSQFQERINRLFDMWHKVLLCISGRHPWVGQVALRLVWKHVEPLNPVMLSAKNKQETFLHEPGNLFVMIKKVCSTLDCDEAEQQEDVDVVIKALTWALKAAHDNSELCSSGDDDKTRNGVKWMMTRLSNIAKPKGTKRRQAVFKCFAAFARFAGEIAFDYLELMIDPLYRVEREANNEMETAISGGRAFEDKETSAETLLAKDVLHLFEELCVPHDKFIEAYGSVKRQAQDKKSKRIEFTKAEAARDPRFAAGLKVKKQEHEKQRRKRRVEEKRHSQGRVARRRRN